MGVYDLHLNFSNYLLPEIDSKMNFECNLRKSSFEHGIRFPMSKIHPKVNISKLHISLQFFAKKISLFRVARNMKKLIVQFRNWYWMNHKTMNSISHDSVNCLSRSRAELFVRYCLVIKVGARKVKIEQTYMYKVMIMIFYAISY